MTRLSEPLVDVHLNSVWIEGTLANDPDDLPSAANPGFQFQLQGGPSVFLVEVPDKAVQGSRDRLGQGRRVRIIGRLQQHRWTDPEGRRHSDVKVVGELVEPLGGRSPTS